MTLLTIDWYVRPNRQASIVDIPTYCDVNLLLLDVVLRKVRIMANGHGRVTEPVRLSLDLNLFGDDP